MLLYGICPNAGGSTVSGDSEFLVRLGRLNTSFDIYTRQINLTCVNIKTGIEMT